MTYLFAINKFIFSYGLFFFPLKNSREKPPALLPLNISITWINSCAKPGESNLSSVYSYLSPILFEFNLYNFVDKTGESAAGSECSQDAKGKETTVKDFVVAGLLVFSHRLTQDKHRREKMKGGKRWKEGVRKMYDLDLDEYFLQKRAIGIRFKQFRELLDKSKQELEEETEEPLINEGRISLIELGAIIPHVIFIEYFTGEYGLNITWLVTGTGLLFYKKGSKTPEKIYETFRDTEPTTELIEEVIKRNRQKTYAYPGESPQITQINTEGMASPT